MAFNMQALCQQIRFYLCIAGNPPWLITAVPMHRCGTAGSRQRRQMRRRIAFEHKQFTVK